MYTVLIFYKYVTIKDPQRLAEYVRGACEALSLKGRIILAGEGINATIEGLTDNTTRFEEIIKNIPKLQDVFIKKSLGTGKSFPKLSVKVKPEIVSTQFPKSINPRKKTGIHLAPQKLKEWFSNKEDFVVIDMRNDFEYRSGHFKDSINPGLSASRDLPSAIPNLRIHKDKKIVTVCTAGVRCEKMSAYLLDQGFSQVYQLDGGIHSYMEKYPGQDFLGTLYTFDNRDTMHFGGEREIVGTCKLCGGKTENYYNCANDECHDHFLACDNCVTSEYVFCDDTCKTSVRRLSLSKR